jgi:hypothetical protein
MLSKRQSSEPIMQQSKLLPALFEHIDEDQRLTVFHAGPALAETVDFFSRYRCRLHFVDLFAELPIVANEEDNPSLGQQFGDLLQLPPETRFDICLFWDLFNFLCDDAIIAFLKELRPYLRSGCLAHAFSVHNLKTAQNNQLYGIREMDTLRLRSRQTALPGYAPHNQGRLKTLLSGFTFERSVLLPDSRLELLLRAKA